MALVTVQRSPSVSSCSSPPSSDSGAGIAHLELDLNNPRSLNSECYFAGKGAALVLPSNEKLRPRNNGRRVSASGSDIQQHLQSMFYLLRPEETLKMAVKLESAHASRTRYLVVVSCVGRQDAEESCLLGIDCNEKTTVGLVLRVLADTAITLDGDGGFSVSVCGRQHIFKPVSVQAMWSALQTLHKVSSKAREQNYFLGGLTHDWVSYYEQRIESDRSCLNEWHAMDSLESRRPPSPDSVRHKPREREETERVIRCTLKEIMMSVDLDEVTSKYIRGRLEEDLDMDLGEFKPFIDQEMLTILGQMDAATEIFDHVYLGSEWNASNLEELQKNGVHHILNVTREIDNFFPGMFNYLNVRVYDDEKTDLLKHWDNTFKYISRAKKEGSKVLVHCKMGVSRSASVVIAYAMKAYNWDFKEAFQYVKQKRNCIKPNSSFITQLETYQGILDAMKNKEKLQRSKSETNLKSPGLVAKVEQRPEPESLPSSQLLSVSGKELSKSGGRPKSWSPDNNTATLMFLGNVTGPTSMSLEQLNLESNSPTKQRTGSILHDNHNLNVRLPCGNGQAYSVSQNKVVYLPGSCSQEDLPVPSVKHIVNELELNSTNSNGATSRKISLDRKGLVLNLTNQFESSTSKPGSPTETEVKEESEQTAESQTKMAPQMLTAVLVKKEIWDPGEKESPTVYCVPSSDDVIFVSELKLGEPVLPRKEGDPFSAQLDIVFEREERKQQRTSVIQATPLPPPLLPQCVTELSSEAPVRECPSRQSSWSSYDSAVVLGYQGEARDAPSRQSSWGSGDTRWGGGTLPSRNSSWGSYDMRPPMQYVNERGEKQTNLDDLLGNSSSGMFPYDRAEIPWYPGTVKRTKQKLEESKRVCSESQDTSPAMNVKIHGPLPYRSPSSGSSLPPSDTNTSQPAEVIVHYASSPTLCSSQVDESLSTDKMASSQPNVAFCSLSVSAPTTSSMSLVEPLNLPSQSLPSVSTATEASPNMTVKKQKKVLENLTTKRCISVDASVNVNAASKSPESAESQKSGAGLVKNLKKEFEAKSVNKTEKTSVTESEGGKTRSLPSSPVSTEDLSVKVLVGKYEVSKAMPQPPVPLRKSSLEIPFIQNNAGKHTSTSLLVRNLRNGGEGPIARPPVPHVRGPSPSVVMASVVAKAASKKQQQGKTHPLSRININTSTLYNTM